jgi:hypothetical protein
MVRYRGCDGHYAGVECADAELERYLVLSCNTLARYWKEKGHRYSGGQVYGGSDAPFLCGASSNSS